MARARGQDKPCRIAAIRVAPVADPSLAVLDSILRVSTLLLPVRTPSSSARSAASAELLSYHVCLGELADNVYQPNESNWVTL